MQTAPEILVIDDGPLGSHAEDVTTIDAMAYFRLVTQRPYCSPAPMQMRHADHGYVRVEPA